MPRYAPRHILTALRNPGRALGELRQIGQEANVTFHQRFSDVSGTKIMAETWDNLLLLDGCRYDLFEERNTLPGTLETRRSLGSESWEFLQANFCGEQHHDTVYVTSNPHIHWLEDDVFHAIVNCLKDNWDETLGTVPPDAMSEAAARAASEYPNKRLIVHYMQPHYPFIGEKGEAFDHRGIGETPTDIEPDTHDVWTLLRRGTVDQTAVWEAYAENLDLVLDSVTSLLPELDGRTVVTSDHGNLVGDRLSPIPTRGFGHPRGLHVPELVNVPWLIIETDSDRPTITTDSPESRSRVTQDIIDDRLENLGYTT